MVWIGFNWMNGMGMKEKEEERGTVDKKKHTKWQFYDSVYIYFNYISLCFIDNNNI